MDWKCVNTVAMKLRYSESNKSFFYSKSIGFPQQTWNGVKLGLFISVYFQDAAVLVEETN